MAYLFTKTIISAIIIVTVSEISRRYSTLGAILASLPLISYLGLIWLYIDTGNVGKVARLSFDIFWMVLPSLSLFIIMAVLLKYKFNFYLALLISTSIMVILYLLMSWILQKTGLSF